jgi:periodic tryptophan protein 1
MRGARAPPRRFRPPAAARPHPRPRPRCAPAPARPPASRQVEPAAALGGVDPEAAGALSREEKRKARKKAAKKGRKPAAPLRPGSHAGAVLGLSWNGAFRNVLASGSADATVKVWDVAAGRCEHTLTHHTDKVQAVLWNPAEAHVLLTGSYDRTAALADARTPGGGGGAGPPKWRVSADVEALAWAPHAPTVFLVSSEDGLVAAFDARGGAGRRLLGPWAPGGVGSAHGTSRFAPSRRARRP